MVRYNTYVSTRHRLDKANALQECFEALILHPEYSQRFGEKQHSAAEVFDFVLRVTSEGNSGLYQEAFDSSIVHHETCTNDSCAKETHIIGDLGNTLQSTDCSFTPDMIKDDRNVSLLELLDYVYCFTSVPDRKCVHCHKTGNVYSTTIIKWPRILIINLGRLCHVTTKNGDSDAGITRILNRVTIPMTITLPNCGNNTIGVLRAVWFHLDSKKRYYSSDNEDSNSYRAVDSGHYICLIVSATVDNELCSFVTDDDRVYPVDHDTFMSDHARKITGLVYETMDPKYPSSEHKIARQTHTIGGCGSEQKGATMASTSPSGSSIPQGASSDWIRSKMSCKQMSIGQILQLYPSTPSVQLVNDDLACVSPTDDSPTEKGRLKNCTACGTNLSSKSVNFKAACNICKRRQYEWINRERILMQGQYLALKSKETALITAELIAYNALPSASPLKTMTPSPSSSCTIAVPPSDSPLKTVTPSPIPSAPPRRKKRKSKKHVSKIGALIIEILHKSYTCPKSLNTKTFVPGNGCPLLASNSPKVGTFNVRSLRAFLRSSYASSFMKDPLDVLILTEVQSPFHKLACLPMVRTLLQSYEVSFWNAATKPNATYSGTAILCRKRPSSVLFGFHASAGQDHQGRIITVRFSDCSIVGVYCPAVPHDNIAFIQSLSKHVEVEQCTLPTFVVGDMNCPRTAQDISEYSPWVYQMNKKELERSNPDSNGDAWLRSNDPWQELKPHFEAFLLARALCDIGQNSGRYTWFPEPTRHSQIKRIGMRIDFALSPKQFSSCTLSILSHVRGSDHRPVVMDISVKSISSDDALRNNQLSMTVPQSGKALKDELTFIKLLTNLCIEDSNDSNDQEDIVDTNSSYPDFGTISSKTNPETIILPMSKTDPDSSTFTPITQEGIKGGIFKIYNESRTIGIRVRLRLELSNIITALIDTGSTHTLVQYKFAEAHISNFKSRFKPMEMEALILGDGSRSLKPLGYVDHVKLHFEKSNDKYVLTTTTVVIVRGLPDDIIIGHEFFLRSHKHEGVGNGPRAEISYARQSLRLGHIHIPWAYYNDGDVRYSKLQASTDLVYAQGDTRLPAQAITQVQTRYREQLTTATWGIFHDISPQGADSNLIGCFGHMPSTGKMLLWIANSSTTELLLKSGVALALFEKRNISDFGVIWPSHQIETMKESSSRHETPQTTTVDERVMAEKAEPNSKLETNKISSSPEYLLSATAPIQSKCGSSLNHILRTSEEELKTSTTNSELKTSTTNSPFIPGTTTVPSARTKRVIDLGPDLETRKKKTKVYSANKNNEENVVASAASPTWTNAQQTSMDLTNDVAAQPISMDLTNDVAQPAEQDDLKQNLLSDATKVAISVEMGLLTIPTANIKNYFDNNELSDKKMPSYIKGLRLSPENCHATNEEINFFIHHCFETKPGREKLFTLNNTPGLVEDFEVKVDISDKSAWQSRLIPCSPADKMEIRTLIKDYLKNDMIEASQGPYSCACLLVRKDNGRHKIACCLTTLNQRSRKSSYTVPLIRDNLDALSGSKYLSSLDICGGYLSMPIKPEDRDYFAFITHFGLYRWKRVPYGWRNAGSHFCFLIDKILAGLKYQILTSYVDDILIYGGRTFIEHVACLNIVMDRLQEPGLTLSINKCYFFKKIFTYLGFQITREGVKPSTTNTEKILESKCESLADLRSFLGLTGFYRRWIKKYAQHVVPIRTALKSKRWTDISNHYDLNVAMKYIKGVLTTYPVLQHPNFERRFFLKTDGSEEGFGAVLDQMTDDGKYYAISYASSGLPAFLKGSYGGKIEAAAACWAMVYFRPYLLGRQFTLRTDNRILKHLRARSEPPIHMAQYVLESQEFDWVLEHVPGPQHQVADYMSRSAARGTSPDFETFKKQEAIYMKARTPSRLEHPDTFLLDIAVWIEHQSKDLTICKVRTLISMDSPKSKYYCLHNGMVCYKPPQSKYPPRIWVPAPLYHTVVHHNHNLLGHRGANSTLDSLIPIVYWPQMKKYVRRFVKACIDCQRRKTPRPWRSGLTGSILATEPGQMYCMDFLMKDLPTSPHGYKHALVVVDVFSRYPFVIPTRSMKCVDVAEGLIEHVFTHTSLPLGVHSDNAPELVDTALKIVFEKFGVRRTTCAAHHPQGNAPAERFMRYLNSGFSIMLPKYDRWPSILPLILFAYRVLPQATTGYSPFFLWYGRQATLPLNIATKPVLEFTYDHTDPESYADEMIKTISDTFTLVRERQDRASRNNALRRDDNEKRTRVTFGKGDPVLLWEPNVKSSTGTESRTTLLIREAQEIKVPSKWKLNWSGPHVILRKLNDNVYEYFHRHHQKTMSANVDRLIMYHPFKDINHFLPPCGLIDKIKPPESVRDATSALPTRPGRGPTHIAEISPGDLCLVTIPNNDIEPIAVMRYLDSTSNGVSLQWMGSRILYWYIDCRFQQQKWRNGWYDTTDRKYYWQRIPKKNTLDIPFTNDHSKEPIQLSDIFLFGFDLMQDLRIPPHVQDIALSKYRQLDNAGIGTYELYQR